MSTLPWTRSPLVGVDLETTSVDVETARIVTASVVRWGGGMPTDPWTWMSDVGGAEIPAAATAIHQVTTEQARAFGRPAASVVAEIVEALGSLVGSGWPVVAMNAQFDLTILERECARYGVPSLWKWASPPLVLDPRVIDKQLDRYRSGRRRLVDLCHHYRVRMEGGAHSAEVDAKAACGVVWKIGQRYPKIAKERLSELHEMQIGWAREQHANLMDYRRRKGVEVDEAPFDWPLIPQPAGAGA